MRAHTLHLAGQDQDLRSDTRNRALESRRLNAGEASPRVPRHQRSLPQQATVLSFRTPQVCPAPAETETNSPTGGVA